MIKKILIANRGEIACRVIKTSRDMGIKTVAVYSDADRNSLHVRMADEAVWIGEAASSESYLRGDRIIAACKSTGADAVHPGYGFLSENANFAEALAEAGIVFIGPPQSAIAAMGDKITSKKIAAESGVSTVPGFMGIIEDAETATRIASEIGYPVMIKASAGGGGKGMRIAYSDSDVLEGFQAAKNEAASSFGDDRIFIEKYIETPRHIEIQILADQHGNCVYLGERECSIQRRNQKVIEEAPSPFLDEVTRQKMGQQACDLALAVDYCSAGTVEFIVDKHKNFYFLEMNTRLQVEHPVTELVTGIDLVEQMIRVAAGEKLSVSQSDISLNGWAIESRIYAEDPYRNFLPSIGRLSYYAPPSEFHEQGRAVRVDTGVYEGSEISMFYDPMIAKLCTFGASRDDAVDLMSLSLDQFAIDGVSHNIPFVNAIIRSPRFRSGDIATTYIAEEFPNGFSGGLLSDSETNAIASIAVALFRISEIRRTKISGRTDNHERRVGNEWIVRINDVELDASILAENNSARVVINDVTQCEIVGGWSPGRRQCKLSVNGEVFAFRCSETVDGFRFQTRGADVSVQVIPKKLSKMYDRLLDTLDDDDVGGVVCPMPGLITSLMVNEGDTVEAGQAVCAVEAMKMENILRSEKAGRIKKINVAQGQTVSVDELIMEIE